MTLLGNLVETSWTKQLTMKKDVETAEQAKNVSRKLATCRETQQVCLYYTQKLIMHHEETIS